MHFLKKNLNRLILIIFTVAFPILSFAQDCNPSGGRICNPISGASTVNEFIATILSGFIRIGMPVVALAIIYCGFLFVAARGKPEAITKARDALMYTLIGAAVLLGSWAIAQLVSDTIISLY